MKKETHPQYRKVLFVDSSTGFRFVCGSTLVVNETEVFEGVEYPVCRVSISSASHPFYTGGKQTIDTEGRMQRFAKRYQQAAEKIAAKQEKEKENAAQKKTAKKAPAKKKR